MSQTAFYAVKVGRNPGLYSNWEDADKETKGFPGNVYKKFKTLEDAQKFLNEPLPKIESSATFYAVVSGRKPGIYEKLEDALKQTSGFPSFCFKKFKSLDLAQKFLKDKSPNTTNVTNTFYAVKTGRRPGIYEKLEDAVKQTNGFPGGALKKFETKELAEIYLKDTSLNSDDGTAFYAVRLGHKPGIYKTKADAEKQIRGFSYGCFKRFKTLKTAQNYLKKPLMIRNNSTAFYAVKFGQKPEIYEEFEDAVKQIKDIPSSFYKKFQTLELAQNYLKDYSNIQNNVTEFYLDTTDNRPSYEKGVDSERQIQDFPHLSFKTLECPQNYLNKSLISSSNSDIFYAVKIGHKPGIYEKLEDAIKQINGFPGGLFKKFKILEDAQIFLEDPIVMRDKEVAFYAVKIGKKPGIYSNEKEAEEQTRDFPDSYVRKFKTLEFAQLFLNGCFPNCDNKIADDGVIYESKPVISNARQSTIKLYNECCDKGDAFKYVRKATKHKITGLDINHLVAKKIKMDESGRCESALQVSGESVAVFTSGKIVDDGKEKRAGIGVYWGPNHHLNVSRRITENQFHSQAKKYAIIHAVYQAKEFNVEKVTLYSDWWDIQNFARLKANGWKTENSVMIDDITPKFRDLKALDMAHEGIDIKYKYVKGNYNKDEPLLLKENSSYYMVDGELLPCIYEEHGVCEASKLAFAGCDLCLTTENISEFESVYKEKFSSLKLNDHNHIKIEQFKNSETFSENNVKAPSFCKSSTPNLSNIIKEEPCSCYYAVRRGHVPGIYYRWEDCKNQLIHFSNPFYKIFHVEDDAKKFLLTGDSETYKSAHIDPFVPKEKININQDDTGLFIRADKIHRSGQSEFCVPKREVDDNKEYALHSILINEVHNNAEVELSVPKIKVEDKGYFNVFICGRSFISDSERAGIGIYWSSRNELNTSLRLFGQQTNERADLWAAIHAFWQAKQFNLKTLCVHTDSQFVLKEVVKYLKKYKEKNWKIGEGLPAVYQEDFKALDEAMKGLTVEWCHIKERNDCFEFVEAERLAVAGCNKIAMET